MAFAINARWAATVGMQTPSSPVAQAFSTPTARSAISKAYALNSTAALDEVLGRLTRRSRIDMEKLRDIYIKEAKRIRRWIIAETAQRTGLSAAALRKRVRLAKSRRRTNPYVRIFVAAKAHMIHAGRLPTTKLKNGGIKVKGMGRIPGGFLFKYDAKNKPSGFDLAAGVAADAYTKDEYYMKDPKKRRVYKRYGAGSHDIVPVTHPQDIGDIVKTLGYNMAKVAVAQAARKLPKLRKDHKRTSMRMGGS